MLACKSESMQLSALKARITALGAIGPPNIVDLPEFAPVFPTTALFGWAFRCFERLECLECRAHLSGIQERLPRGELFVLVSGKEFPNSAARARVDSRMKRACRGGPASYASATAPSVALHYASATASFIALDHATARPFTCTHAQGCPKNSPKSLLRNQKSLPRIKGTLKHP